MAIRPITTDQREYDPSYAEYGVIKFIAKDGEGHRGVICWLSPDKTRAILWGITGEYGGKVVVVQEYDPQKWPEQEWPEEVDVVLAIDEVIVGYA